MEESSYNRRWKNMPISATTFFQEFDDYYEDRVHKSAGPVVFLSKVITNQSSLEQTILRMALLPLKIYLIIHHPSQSIGNAAVDLDGLILYLIAS